MIKILNIYKQFRIEYKIDNLAGNTKKMYKSYKSNENTKMLLFLVPLDEKIIKCILKKILNRGLVFLTNF